jgi:hypothetical protein
MTEQLKELKWLAKMKLAKIKEFLWLIILIDIIVENAILLLKKLKNKSKSPKKRLKKKTL